MNELEVQCSVAEVQTVIRNFRNFYYTLPDGVKDGFQKPFQDIVDAVNHLAKEVLSEGHYKHTKLSDMRLTTKQYREKYDTVLENINAYSVVLGDYKIVNIALNKAKPFDVIVFSPDNGNAVVTNLFNTMDVLEATEPMLRDVIRFVDAVPVPLNNY